MQTSHFELFRIEPRFALGTESLETAYHAVVSQVHPDRFAQADAAGRRRAIETAAAANEAYRTLKKPLLRARYLLDMRGVETGSSSSLPPSLLMRQLEWREILAEAKSAQDADALAGLASAVRFHAKTLQERVEAQLDRNGDDIGAARSVDEWFFVEKLISDIDDALASMEP